VTLLPSILTFDGATHIAFRNVIFEGARDNAVTVNNSENVVLTACTIRNSGKWAVTITGGRLCAVRGSDIYGLGDGGVSLEGGDRATLTPAGHVVENCHIHHYSRWNRTYKPAVSISGVGNRVLRNLIHHAPHQACNSAATTTYRRQRDSQRLRRNQRCRRHLRLERLGRAR
jgi:hypothetical protein